MQMFLHWLAGSISALHKVIYCKISESLEGTRLVLVSFPITLEIDKHLSSAFAELPAKFQGNASILTPNRIRDHDRS